MGGREHVGFGTEDMIGGERVAFAWAFAADVAVGCGLPHQSSTLWVVALVVRSRCVPDCLTLTGADQAAGGLGGESATLDAWTANGHGAMGQPSCVPMRAVLGASF